MLPLRDCRGYRSRYINALNRAVRSLTPIAGRGIRLRQSAQGVVIEATAKGGGAAIPFRHRWQVTHAAETADDETTTHRLKIAQGSLWRNDGQGLVDCNAQPDGVTVKNTVEHGWTVENATTGSLYVVDNGEGTTGARFQICYGNLLGATASIVLRVADFSVGSSGVKLTQRQVGDALYSVGVAEERRPIFLEVRKRTFGGTECWCVYLGNVILNGDFPKKEADAAPWEWEKERVTISRIGDVDSEGWASLGGETESGDVVYCLRFTYNPTAGVPAVPNGFSVFRGTNADTLIVPELVWSGSEYMLYIPFAEGDGYGGLNNIHYGIPTFQFGSVGQSGAVLKQANASSYPWQKFVSVGISSAYQMALVEWAGLTVTIGYGAPGASGQSAQYRLPFDEALIASSHVDCVSHAEDHLFGIV